MSKPWLKVGVVAAGYVVAFLVASAAVAIRLASTSGPDPQAAELMSRPWGLTDFRVLDPDGYYWRVTSRE